MDLNPIYTKDNNIHKIDESLDNSTLRNDIKTNQY